MKLFAVLFVFVLHVFPQCLIAKDLRVLGRTFESSVAVYGSFLIPPGVNEKAGENAKFELYIRPSITLVKFSEKIKLSGYSIVGLFADRKGLSYNNKATASLGVELEYKLSNAVRLSAGVKFKSEYEFRTGQRRSKPILTADLSVYKTWRPDWLQKRFSVHPKLVLSGWANYRYPSSLHVFEKGNGLLQGSFKLAVSVPVKDTKLSLAPFVSIKAKTDNKGRAYNNYVEPAIGLDLSVPFKNGGSISFGTKAAHQWRFGTGIGKTKIIGYTTWYKRF